MPSETKFSHVVIPAFGVLLGAAITTLSHVATSNAKLELDREALLNQAKRESDLQYSAVVSDFIRSFSRLRGTDLSSGSHSTAEFYERLYAFEAESYRLALFSPPETGLKIFEMLNYLSDLQTQPEEKIIKEEVGRKLHGRINEIISEIYTEHRINRKI